MFARFVTIISLCAALTACAQSPLLPAADFNSATLPAAPSVSTYEMQYLGQRTLAGKVMTAIALERVTGLKPDPARFSDIE
ncbi:MAG: hypothetical protein KJ622_02955 [Alphaproteobacteria bacterium]|nr:hypothetical protein [Alphaproteobacteria bacterium]